MKKNRIITILAMAGAALVLAACSPGSILSGARIASEWETAPGQYVVCQNFDNQVTFQFNLLDPDTLLSVRRVFKGENIHTYDFDETLRATDRDIRVDGKRVTVSTELDRFAVPYGLASSSDFSPSAIVVVPRPEDDPAAHQGTLRAQYIVKTHGGTYTLPGVERYYELPVWGGCEEA